MTRKKLLVLLSLSFCFITAINSNLMAQNNHEGEKKKHLTEHHHLSVFTGFTLDYKGQNGYKVGLEYEERLNETFGIGGAFDWTGANFGFYALSAGVTLYPFKQIPLSPAASFGIKNTNGKWKEFYRVMLTYIFHVEKISIAPMIMHDFFSNEHDITSYGVTLGFNF